MSPAIVVNVGGAPAISTIAAVIITDVFEEDMPLKAVDDGLLVSRSL